jgi:hypothetical protein
MRLKKAKDWEITLKNKIILRKNLKFQQVPSSYELMVRTLILFGKKKFSGNTGILIYQVPLSVINNQNSIVANITNQDS